MDGCTNKDVLFDEGITATAATNRMNETADYRIALVGIIVQDPQQVETLNSVLHDYRAFIRGRMGLPFNERGLSVISVVVDAPPDVISALAGKIGMLDGVSSKSVFPKA